MKDKPPKKSVVGRPAKFVDAAGHTIKPVQIPLKIHPDTAAAINAYLDSHEYRPSVTDYLTKLIERDLREKGHMPPAGEPEARET